MAKIKKTPRNRISRDQRRINRNKKLMSYVLVVLMIASVAGIYASSRNQDGDLEYNGYNFDAKFIPDAGNQQVLTTIVNNNEVYFYMHPLDVLAYPTEGNVTKVIRPVEYVYLSTDNDPNFASLYDLIRFEFSSYAGKTMPGGVLMKNQSDTLPVITCENATIAIPVIEFRQGTNTSTVVKGNCVIITSTPNNLAYVRDRLMYSALGIING